MAEGTAFCFATFLRTLPLAFTILLASPVLAVNWEPLGKPLSGKFQLFIDVDSIRVSDGLVYFWSKSEYSPPAIGPGGAQYSLLEEKFAANCSDGSSATIQYSFFSSSGSLLHTRTFKPNEWQFNGGSPGSTGETQLDFVCKWVSRGNGDPASERRDGNHAGKGKIGSGFVIDRSGGVVTNQHVIDGCSAFKVIHEGRSYPAELIGSDKSFDLALLRYSSPNFATPALLRQGVPDVGEVVYVAGFPLAGLLANDMNFTDGTVSSSAGIGGDVSRLQITAPVQAGNSGGPLLDVRGHIVGVIVSKLNAINISKAVGDLPQNVNFAIKGDMLRIFLDAHRIKLGLGSAAAKVDPVQIAKRARDFTVQVSCE